MSDIDFSWLEKHPALMRPREVASLLRCSGRTLLRMIQDGRLKALKLNAGKSGKVVIPRDELRKFLEQAAQ